jgi:4-amino-4-deoxy-L-arabinose transferase-like glycosyltransferase
LSTTPKKPVRRATKALWGILGVAFAARVTIFLFALQDPQRFYSPDAQEYWPLAQHFRAAFTDTKSEFFELGLKRTPGYPGYIAAITTPFGDHESLVVFTQILLSVATVGLLYVLARELWGTRAALVAAGLLAIDPISVIMPSYLQPETLFTLLLVAATLVLVRGVRARSWPLVAVAGLTFGVAVLVRPVALYMLVVLVPITWVLASPRAWRERIALSGVLVIAFAVPVGGWIIRNERTTGVFILSTIEGRDLLRFRAAHALAFEEGIPVGTARDRLLAKVERESEGKNPAERSRAETSEAIKTMLDHPVGTAVSTARGMSRLVFGPGRAEFFRLVGADDPNRIRGDRLPVIGLEFVILLVILVGAVAGAVIAALRRRWAAFSVGVGCAAYLIVVASSGGAFSRYRAPASPYLALLAGIAGAVILAKTLPATRRSRAADRC